MVHSIVDEKPLLHIFLPVNSLPALKTYCLLFFLLLMQARVAVFAQPDSILAAPPEQQIMLSWKWWNKVTKLDSAVVMPQLIKAEELFDQKGKTLLRQQAWLMQYLYRAWRLNYENNCALMLEAAKLAEEKNWPLIQAECQHYAGLFCFIQGSYGPAFEYMLRAQNIFSTENYGAYSYALRYSDGLANCYYRFGEYEQSLKYLKQTMKLPAYWSPVVYFPSIYNTIALCYRHLNKYDSAEIWFSRAHEAATLANDSFYMALSNGNLGQSYYLQGQYDKALLLLETDYQVSLRSLEKGSATNAAIVLASIHIKKGELVQAEKYIDACREFVSTSHDISLLNNWYENLYRFYKAKKDYKNVGLYTDSLLMYKDSVAARRDKKTYNQALLKIEAEQHINEVSRLESQRKQQILLRNSLLTGLVLLSIIALLGVNRQLLKRNKEKALAEQQLHFAQQELLHHTHKLKEKNELLEQLRNEMSSQLNGNERIENINRLHATTILTDEDWKTFRELFEKVYPGFFIRLKEKMPDLGAADTRLLALTKLQLPPKDMAAMLGVSYDAIKKARQRLRKKINLPEEGSLDELVEMI